MADFKEVKEKVSLYRAAELLGLQTRRGNNQLRAPCPACKGDDPRALAITGTPTFLSNGRPLVGAAVRETGEHEDQAGRTRRHQPRHGAESERIQE